MARAYTIVWTPTGGTPVTLCDLDQGWHPVFEQWPVEALEQQDRLAFGPAAFHTMRGNVSGEAVFTITKSHDSLAAAAQWFQSICGLHARSAVIGNGLLAITIGETVWSYSSATFRRIEVVRMNGLEWALRYRFGVSRMDPVQTDEGAEQESPPPTDPAE